MNEPSTNMLDVLIILAKGKKTIIVFTFIMCIIAVAYALLAEEKWTSFYTVFPITNTGPLSMAMNLMEGLGLSTQTTPKVVNLKNAAILQSKSITETTIRKYNFINYFKITEKDTLKAMDKAVRQFNREILKIVINDEVQFMTVNLTTKDRYFSKELAEYYLTLLIKYAQDNTNNQGKQKRELLENRINQITSDMTILSNSMKKYQKEHNIIEIEQQAKASVEGYSSILTELFTVDLELGYTEKFMPNSPKHRDLVDRKLVIEETLSKLEKNNEGMPFFLTLNNINDQLFTIQEMVFGLEIYKLILQTIYPQYELARLEEINNMDQLEIIDFPSLAGKRTYPKRPVICIFTFFISLLFSISYVLLKSIMSGEDKQKIKIIRDIFLHGKHHQV